MFMLVHGPSLLGPRLGLPSWYSCVLLEFEGHFEALGLVMRILGRGPAKAWNIPPSCETCTLDAFDALM